MSVGIIAYKFIQIYKQDMSSLSKLRTDHYNYDDASGHLMTNNL